MTVWAGRQEAWIGRSMKWQVLAVIAMATLKFMCLESAEGAVVQRSGLGFPPCTEPCQLATCDALRSFFLSTSEGCFDQEDPWRNRHGWEALLTKNCSQIVGTSSAAGLPIYCEWHGVNCCPVPGYCEGSVVGLVLEVNGLCGSITDSRFEQSIVSLHQFGLMQLVLTGNSLTGSLDDFWGQLVNLRLLVLAKNMITGTIPNAMRNMVLLQALVLDRNPMHGHLPEWLSELQSLQFLGLSALSGINDCGRKGLVGTIPNSLQLPQLSVLAMEYNSLNGSLPANICHDKLTIISLTGNQITGNLTQLLQCKNLEVLNIGSNLFSGTLPNDFTWGWEALRWLDLSSNVLEGTLPPAIYKLQQLAYLNLADNRLSGTIRGSMIQMSLMTLLLNHNQFSTIDKSLWYSPRLTKLNLAHNNISGTLGADIRASFYMESLMLSHNRFTGTVPSELGSLNSLKEAGLTGNLLSCAGAETDSRCPAGQLLPCFLQLSSVIVPRPDQSAMECPYVERKPIRQQLEDCESQINTHKDHYNDGQDYRLDWELDPSYYQYQGCRCLQGYVAVWSQNDTSMSCEPVGTPYPPAWLKAMALTLTIVGIPTVSTLGALFWYKTRVQLRRRWQRERELMKHRAKGVPSGGPATIVVTDVEGYSDLLQQNAQATMRALGIHNAILRKAVNTHAGHVIEQEGDSWSVAFHRPMQAVAFCLQVQQALQKSLWPAELGVPASMHFHDGTTASDTINMAEITAEIRVTEPSLATASHVLGPGPLFNHSSDKATLPLDTSSCRGPWESEAGSNKQKLARTLSAKSRHLHRYGPGTVTNHQSTQQNEQRLWMEAPVKSSNSNASTIFTRYEGSMTSMKGTKSVIRGLKVRMGVASGWVPADDEITRSALFELAQAVSGMANGGQVLLETNAAAAVCDLLIELGGVTHKGYSDKRLSEAYHAEVKRNTSKYLWWILDCVSCTLRVTARDREPLLLDMGQFSVPRLHSAIIAAAPASNRSNRSTADLLAASDTGPCKEASTSSSHTSSMLSPWARAAQSPCIVMNSMTADLQLCSASSTYPEANLQLYSITPVSCQARCKVWKGSLNLKEGTRQIVKGYFDAPGTDVADLHFENALMPSRQTILPAVTLVFAAVQGGRTLVHKHAKVATSVHQRLSRAMQALLMTFPDGYLCRGYEAELKYMLAFREPTRAVEWCLCLQELLDRIMWPTDVIKYYRSTTTGSTADVRTSGDLHNSIGRRPTLKFGLAEGVPDYMAPDHQGHADYFGSSVNLAARILTAAAHAGQIVMSCDLAQSIFSSWSYEAEFGPRDGLPLTCKQHNQLSKVASSDSPTTEAPACIKLEPPVILSSFQTAAEAGSAIDITPAPSAASLKINLTLDSRTIWEARNCSSQPASPRRSAIMSSSQPASPRRTTGQVRWSGIDCSIGWQQEQCTAGSFDGNVLQDKLSKHLSPLQLHVHQSQSHDGTNGTSPRSQAFLNNTCRQHSSDRQTVDEVKGSSRHVLQVSAYHLGTYAFKGCGEMQMVCLASDARAVAAEICAITPPRGSKGVLVSPASGPVVGLQHCTVALPDMWRVTEDRLVLSPSPTL